MIHEATVFEVELEWTLHRVRVDSFTTSWNRATRKSSVSTSSNNSSKPSNNCGPVRINLAEARVLSGPGCYDATTGEPVWPADGGRPVPGVQGKNLARGRTVAAHLAKRPRGTAPSRVAMPVMRPPRAGANQDAANLRKRPAPPPRVSPAHSNCRARTTATAQAKDDMTAACVTSVITATVHSICHGSSEDDPGTHFTCRP
jgi:hypothetical protein